MSRGARANRDLRRSLAGPGLKRHPSDAAHARRAVGRWGATSAAACEAASAISPRRAAVIDEHASITFAQLNTRSGALAGALGARGVRPGQTIAIQCANHHWLLEAQVAASRLGANLVLLSPEAPEEVLHRALASHRAVSLIEDPPRDESAAGPRALVLRARNGAGERLEDMIAERLDSPAPPARTEVPGLTLIPSDSGGAFNELHPPGTLSYGLLDRCEIPLARRQTTVICAPLCSHWGHLHLTLAQRLSSTIVLAERFDPIDTLAAVEANDASALALLPGQLAEILVLPAPTLAWYRTAHLRVIAVHGSTLPGQVAIPAIERFGTVLYNRSGPPMITLESGAPLVVARPA
jgi:fatty-acyl-CoA synthase